ncbi:hypothetical protein MLD38_018432 [Melastoma candidum]|uniref:Uncharacterized protein n=1 Tax=Melastoma candidum TaxID=119954 RepID=A0ACB9QTT9_9MYRT|nr:hypothetical protein MLD38_018432 [Melastoma candidum]
MNGGSASSSPVRPTTAGSGAGNAAGAAAVAAAEEFHFPSELISVHDRKDQALHVLKSDLMAALNKEVKSLDEDSWMFEGPRSRISLMSRPGGFLPRQMDHSGKEAGSLKHPWR